MYHIKFQNPFVSLARKTLYATFCKSGRLVDLLKALTDSHTHNLWPLFNIVDILCSTPLLSESKENRDLILICTHNYNYFINHINKSVFANTFM